MAEYTPTHSPGADITCIVGATAITGGQVVYASGAGRTVLATTAASPAVIGVARHDAAVGANVDIASGGVQRLIASAAIAAGTPVKSAAAGKVAAWVNGTDAAQLKIGTALDTATADGDLIDVKWSGV